jgi:hypothetical protein
MPTKNPKQQQQYIQYKQKQKPDLSSLFILIVLDKKNDKKIIIIIINHSNIVFFIRISINTDFATPELNIMLLNFIVISFPLSFFDGIICLSRCLSHKVRATVK